LGWFKGDSKKIVNKVSEEKPNLTPSPVKYKISTPDSGH